MGQKDLAAKELEGRPEVFADIINALIYQGEQVISPEELRAAPTETLYESVRGGSNEEPDKGKGTYELLHDQYNDVSKYEMDDRNIKMQYILENESGEDYRLILRKAGYEGAVYRDEYDAKQIYPVVILVLYWGDKEWKPHLDVHELFKDKLTDETIKEYVDNIKLHIFPMAHLPKEVRQRFQSDMRFIVDYLAEGISYTPTDSVIKYIGPTMRLMYAMTGEEEALDMIVEMQYRQEKGEEVKMGEYYITKCVREGRQEGIQEGMQKGMQEGMKKGIQKGIQKGMDLISDLTSALLDAGREGDLRRSLEDKEYREKLLKEFNL